MASSQQDTLRDRFAHLLQPIRDLAQNWSIDVAKDLEEYLEELEHIQISFDGGKTTLNFAEAAMLIQGSAAVYSRKVEYLYALIYQTLDLITAQRKKGKKGGAASVRDADADELLRAEAEAEFLLLDADGAAADAALPRGRNIDLKERREDVELQTVLTYGLAGGQQAAASSGAPSGIALAAAHAAQNALAPMLNLSVMSSFGGGANNNNMSSTHGGSLGASYASDASGVHVGDVTGLPGLALNVSLAAPAAQRAHAALLAKSPLAVLGQATFGGGRAGNLGGGGGGGAGGLVFGSGDGRSLGIGGGFRVANAAVSKSGALVLDGGASSSSSSSAATTRRYMAAGSLLEMTVAPMLQRTIPAAAAPIDMAEATSDASSSAPPTHLPAQAQASAPSASADESTGGDAGGAGFDEMGWYADDAASSSSHEAGEPDAAAVPAEKRVTRAATGSLPAPRAPLAAASSTSRPVTTTKTLDPWAALDPNQDAGAASHKPFRAARTWLKLVAPDKIAAKGPEAVAAELAATRAKGERASNARLAKQLMAQARTLAQRAAAVRAAGPLNVTAAGGAFGSAGGASFASLIPAAATAGTAGGSSSSSSSSRFVASDCALPISQALAALTSSFAAAGAAGGGAAGASSSSSSSSSAGASGGAAGVATTCPEMEALLRRARQAGQKARRAHRQAVAAAFPTAAAAGGAYEDTDFLAGAAADDDDDDGGAGYGYGAGANAGHAADFADDDGGNVDALGGEPLLSYPSGGDDGARAGVGAAGAAAGPSRARGNAFFGVNFGMLDIAAPDDAMQYLEDAEGGDAAFVRGRKGGIRFSDEVGDAGAGEEAARLASLMRGTDGEDDEFHSMVKASVASYTANAEAYMSSSRSQRRIDAWARRMEPLLAEEEGRPEFDIAVYGDKLLSAMNDGPAAVPKAAAAMEDDAAVQTPAAASASSSSSSPATLDFASVVRSLKPEPYEVCRHFLALLQLAANGNVDLVPEPSPVAAAAAAPGAKKGAAAGKKKGGKADVAADGSDEAWMFSQAITYADDSSASSAAAARAESARGARLSADFPEDGHIPVPSSFGISLLSTRPGYDLDGYVAPSQVAAAAAAAAAQAAADELGSAAADPDSDDDAVGAATARSRAQAAMRSVLAPAERLRPTAAPTPALRAAAAPVKRGRMLRGPGIAAITDAPSAKRGSSVQSARSTDDVGAPSAAMVGGDDDEQEEEEEQEEVEEKGGKSRSRSAASRTSKGKAPAPAPAAASATTAAGGAAPDVRSPSAKKGRPSRASSPVPLANLAVNAPTSSALPPRAKGGKPPVAPAVGGAGGEGVRRVR